MIPETERERLRSLGERLHRAERPVRILRTLAWGPEIREAFLGPGGERLPRIRYPAFDPRPVIEEVATVRREIGTRGEVGRWLARVADTVETGARLLASTGSTDFFEHSRRLYGAPSDPLADRKTTSLDLARQLDAAMSAFARARCIPESARVAPSEVARQIRTGMRRVFREAAPRVELVDQLSANALATWNRIRIRRGAVFTDRDAAQLLHHEAFIHVATSLNGRAQSELPLLASGHPGTTRTQEGLAVFAEFLSGTMDPDRLRRLADRVLAIQMAVEGADFVEVYRFFAGRTKSREQAFESARRVFRGGVLTGGAPFTKDIAYLDGLLRVHNYLRAAVAAERPDSIELLFCGKLALDDLPAVGQLAAAGLCRPPRFLPPWAEDLRFLVSYLAYSAFLNRVDFERIRRQSERLLTITPPVPWRCRVGGAGESVAAQPGEVEGTG